MDLVLNLNQAPVTITLGNLNKVQGSPVPVSVNINNPVTLNPAPLPATVLTYGTFTNQPSLPGEYLVLATVEDDNYLGSSSANLVIRSRFSALFNGATGDSDDDGDGIPALMEYALGGSIGTDDQSKLPEISTTNGNLTLTAVVRTNDPTLTIEPIRSTNLATGAFGWFTNGTTQTNSPITNGVPEGFQRRIYSTSMTNENRGFLRLRFREDSSLSP